MQLSQLKIGQSGVLSGFSKSDAAKQSRYLSLGLIPGSNVKIIHVAPAGCPWQIKIGTTFLSVRRTDADNILLEAS
ncbi:FeoA family protein [Reinekea thalattae]|uniref:Ferrous iron transport protein A n=1 Tax=Reinekea thalattae TaxID=2593301 RepID=A0A5C8Z9Y8_9GAMM|nr:FeoA family protein [Reinekea thalattae]TXR53630.1 ferrous iron transport protein A [Reinekea thalattae]